MIAVVRSEAPASPAEVDALLARLDEQPGLWMGCDVAADGLYRKASVACAVPALRFALEGATLTVTALTGAGGALLSAWGGERAAGGVFSRRCTSGADALGDLRRFLAQFSPVSAELGFYGAFAFDYDRLGSAEPLPEDGACRFVAYFPERVLLADEGGARWVDFAFSTGREGAVGRVPPARVVAAVDDPPPGGHAQRVARGIERLRRGELHSLVLSQTFRRRAAVAPSRAFGALRARNPYPAMFFCNLGGGELLFGASPDLQLRADGGWVESAPVCGTLRRGGDPVEDAEQAFALLASDKEGAAIALCADSAANEHAAACVPGSVELVSHRRAHFFSTIIHAIDHLRGRRRPGLDGFDLLLAHATPATVTGLPKRAAVRVIAELEADSRGWYAGAVARIGSDGSVEAYTVLRAARVAGGIAEIRTGGNILVDSDPKKEEEESALKAQTLFRVLDGGELRPAAQSVGPIGRFHLLACDDEASPRLANALAAAGAVAGEGGVAVLAGCPATGTAGIPGEVPLLAVGEGALWLLDQSGAVPEVLPTPEYARVVDGAADASGFLASLGSFRAGWYAGRALRPAALPPGWRAAAVSVEGWVLAAQHDRAPRVALLFRPDSVLSLHGGSGRRALQAAFQWLDRGILAGSAGGTNK